MKRYKIIVYSVFISAFGLASCENASFLDEKTFSITSTTNFYKTEKDFKLALIGCYEIINSTSIAGAWMPEGTYSRGLFPILEGCSDVAVGVQTNTLVDFVKGNFLPENAILNKFWSAFFAGISRCNYLLDEIEDKDLDAEFKQQVICETRFLRAFYYYHLAACFGGVPISTTPYPDIKAPRAKVEKVYEQIINDLEFAYANSKAEALFKSGANRWAMGTLLGIVYNYLASCKRYNVGARLVAINPINSFQWVNETEMSQKAATVLKDIIDNSPYTLLPREQYTYLFREGTKSYQYKECLFLSEWNEGVSDAYFTRAYFFVPNGSNKYGGGNGYFVPTYDLYESYIEGDIRKKHNITGGYSAQSKTETIDGKDYFVPIDAPITSYTFWKTGKFRACKPNTFNGLPVHGCVINYPLLRLADVYLQYAEALYFNGNETEARKWFNPIRERIVDPGKTTLEAMNQAYHKENFVEELLDERMRELCFESKRRIDLVRFEKTTEKINGLVGDKGASTVKGGVKNIQANWQYHKIWYPIPQTQIDVNKNLVQNPGYSGESY